MTTTIENKAIKRIISDLATQGITFSFDDDTTHVIDYNGQITGTRPLENVVFTKGNIRKKIAFQIFFRISGLSTIIDQRKKDETYRTIRVTDDMFYTMLKEQILMLFNKTKTTTDD